MKTVRQKYYELWGPILFLKAIIHVEGCTIQDYARLPSFKFLKLWKIKVFATISISVIVQKCFCPSDRTVDPTFQRKYVPAF